MNLIKKEKHNEKNGDPNNPGDKQLNNKGKIQSLRVKRMVDMKKDNEMIVNRYRRKKFVRLYSSSYNKYTALDFEDDDVKMHLKKTSPFMTHKYQEFKKGGTWGKATNDFNAFCLSNTRPKGSNTYDLRKNTVSQNETMNN